MNANRIRAVLFASVAAVLLVGCGPIRDDTTGATRHVVANHIGVEYSTVKAHSTLGKLGCDDDDVAEITMALEKLFDITIDDDELAALSIDGKWKDITILEIANLARSKR